MTDAAALVDVRHDFAGPNRVLTLTSPALLVFMAKAPRVVGSPSLVSSDTPWKVIRASEMAPTELATTTA